MVHAVPPFLAGLPKAELHVHVEGTIAGELLFAIAERNGVELPYEAPEDVLALQARSHASAHENLANFLSCLDASREALRTGRDYHDIALAHFARAAQDNVVYTEVMFDPQQAMRQGLAFADCFEALRQAGRDARTQFGLVVQWIMCFQRDHPLASAMTALERADAYREDIVGVGLDNAEVPGFPDTFAPLFDQARDRGYRLTAHCDVNQPGTLEHIRGCLDTLGVERLDHGINTIQDASLLADVLDRGVALTACPTFYVSQSACPSERLAMMGDLLKAGVLISLNTDDPAQFGSGWLCHTLAAAQSAGGFSDADMLAFMANAFRSAWLPEQGRNDYLSDLEAYAAAQIRGHDT